MNEQGYAPLLSMIGICKKAGRAICGTEMVLDAVRKGDGKIRLVIAAGDASDNTKKKLADKSAYYGVKIIFTQLTSAELGGAVGKSGAVAAVGVTDGGLAAAIEKKLNL